MQKNKKMDLRRKTPPEPNFDAAFPSIRALRGPRIYRKRFGLGQTPWRSPEAQKQRKLGAENMWLGDM